MLLSEEVSSFIHNMKPTNHIILFYDTPESKRDILNTYIANGLENEREGYTSATRRLRIRFARA